MSYLRVRNDWYSLVADYATCDLTDDICPKVQKNCDRFMTQHASGLYYLIVGSEARWFAPILSASERVLALLPFRVRLQAAAARVRSARSLINSVKILRHHITNSAAVQGSRPIAQLPYYSVLCTKHCEVI